MGNIKTRPEQIGEQTKQKIKQAGKEFENKWNQCQALQDSKNQLMQMQAKFDKTSQQIFQNIQTLELYKRFPLEIYEWLHVSDRYLGEVSALLSNFF